MTTPPSASYHKVSIVLHWAMFALIVAAYACIELRELFDKGTAERDLMKTWHFMLGLSVLSLVGFRVLARFLYPAPAITPTPAKWQHRLAKLVHISLYLFMMGMPIGGWLILSGEGKVIPFYGLSLPPLIAPDKAFAEQIESLHECIGEWGYWLIGLHALAALVHHYLLKDNTLVRMLWRKAMR